MEREGDFTVDGSEGSCIVGGVPGGVSVEKVSILSPFVSTLMSKETRVFVGLPLLLLPTMMMLEKENVAVDFVVSSALFG